MFGGYYFKKIKCNFFHSTLVNNLYKTYRPTQCLEADSNLRLSGYKKPNIPLHHNVLESNNNEIVKTSTTYYNESRHRQKFGPTQKMTPLVASGITHSSAEYWYIGV